MKSAKQAIRNSIKQKLSQLTQMEKSEKSCSIRLQLLELGDFVESRVVLIYVSTAEEVDTRSIMSDCLKLGKKLTVPRVSPTGGILEIREINSVDKELKMGAYGILEPIEEKTKQVEYGAIDCVIVPGVAFDYKGNRLGRGKGHYDRLLAGLKSNVAKIGLAFDCQMLETLPTESHDFPIQTVLFA